MKKVLWISRHTMTGAQFSDLERALGDSVELLLRQDTVSSVDDLMPDVLRADVIAAVLPTELLSELVKRADGRPVVQAVSERRPTGCFRTLPDGRTEQEFAFIHSCWQQVVRLELELRTL